jgi:hypothetical protein
MARLLHRAVLSALLAGSLLAEPALAQFGTLFGDPPPRPPGEVPGRRAPQQLPPRDQYPAYPDPVYPDDEEDDPAYPGERYPAQTRPGQPYPGQNYPNQGYPNQGYPNQGYPNQGYPNQGYPNQGQPYPGQARPSQPPAGGIQSQPLPPPPGAGSAPQEQPTARQGDPGAQPGTPPLSGLPPGQRQPRGTPQPSDPSPQPGDEVVVPPPSQKIENKTAVFSGLDKITGRTISFDVAIDETVQFGALQVTPRACYTRPATEAQNTDAFVEVDEVTLQGEVRRIFTGWMFASSPGLNAVEHPIYDVWLTDCKNQEPSVAGKEPPTQNR